MQASAINAPNLCFDPKLILAQNKLDSDNVEKEILGLVIHEVSHMVGTTDEEIPELRMSDAYILQTSVISAIKSKDVYLEIEYSTKNFKQNLERVMQSRNTANLEKVVEMSHLSQQAIAMALSMSLSSINEYVNNSYFNTGYLICRPMVQQKLFAALILNTNLMNYSVVYKGKPAEVFSKTFGDRSEATVFDYILQSTQDRKSKKYVKTQDSAYKKYKLHKIEFGDTATYNIEKAEVDRLLKEVYKQVTIDLK